MVIYIYEPLTLLEVLQGENKMQWEQAIQEEYQSLMNNQTWNLIKLPTRRKPMSCEWVFRIKCKGDGSVDCYKARLVARGFFQTHDVDFDETCTFGKVCFNKNFIGICNNIGFTNSPYGHFKCFSLKNTPRGSLHDITRRILKLIYQTLVCKLNKVIDNLK